MVDDGWDDDWPAVDEPTSTSVFADPHARVADPDAWDDWDDQGASVGGYGGGGHDGHDDGGYDDGGYDDEPDDRFRRGLVSAAVAVLALLVGVGLAAVFQRSGDDADTRALETSRQSSTSSTTTEVAPTIGALPGQPDVGTDTGGDTDSGPTSTSSSSSTTLKAGAGTATTASPPTTRRDEPPEPACASGGGGEPVPWEGEWESRWTSRPQPNDPATISICIDDVTPKVGQKVTVTLKAKDPDAVITEQECGYLVEWDGSMANFCRDYLIGADGPRQTPAEEPGEVLVRFTHVFTEARTFTVVGSVISSRWEGYRSPYSSRAKAELKVAVHA